MRTLTFDEQAGIISKLEVRACNKCGREFPATNEYFVGTKLCKSGISRVCRECDRNDKREYYQANKALAIERIKRYRDANKESVIERSRLYSNTHKKSIAESGKRYRNANKSKIAERMKKYNEVNKECISEYRKRYNEENKLFIKERARRYRESNKEKCKLLLQRYKAKKRLLPATLTIEQWETVKQYFDHKCAYCGNSEPLAQEHFYPVSKGGEFTNNNIIPSCASCNSSKNNKLFNEWYPKFKHYSKRRENKILNFLNYKQGVQQLSLI